MDHTASSSEPTAPSASSHEPEKNGNAGSADSIDYFGLLAFPAWGIKDDSINGRVCSCPAGKHCGSPGKHPMSKGWQEKSERLNLVEKRHIERYLAGRLNIGIRTGEEIFVVEGDSDEAVEWLESRGLSETRINVTRRGKHFLLKAPPDFEIRNTVNLVEGVDQIDIRGKGGFIIGPGSRHVSGHEYYWENDNPILEAPEWLLELIKENQKTTDRVASKITTTYLRGHRSFSPVCIGKRRNTLLYVAASLRSRGYEEEFIYSAVTEINETACEEPLGKKEIQEIVEFACEIKPKREPISEEVRRRLEKLGAAYKRFLFKKPFTLSDKAILLALVDQGIALGEEVTGGVKVPISRRVLAERANVSLDTVTRRISLILEPKGFVTRGNSKKLPDSGFLVLNMTVVDHETGEILLDAEEIDLSSNEAVLRERTTPSVHDKNDYPDWPSDVPKTLFFGSDYVMELRNGPGRIGKGSGDVLDNIKRVLGGTSEVLSKREIAIAMNLDPKNKSHMASLGRYLKKLCERGEIIKDGYNAYKLPEDLDSLIEEDMKEHGEFERRQKEKERFEEERKTYRYQWELWKAAREGRNLDEVEVPEGIRKSKAFEILERQKAKSAAVISDTGAAFPSPARATTPIG